MRFTVVIDDDLHAKLKAEARRTGASFRQVVNETLRCGLSQPEKKKVPPFKIKAKDLKPRPGVNLDSVWKLIEELDFPRRKRKP